MWCLIVYTYIRYMEPLVYGDYPKSMRKLVKDRLPTFSNEEKKMIKGSFDFIGINYYTTRYAKSLPIDLSAPPALNSGFFDEFVNATGNSLSHLISECSKKLNSRS